MKIVLKYHRSKAKVRIYYMKIHQMQKQCKHCKKVALELSENSTKICRKSIKNSPKTGWKYHKN